MPWGQSFLAGFNAVQGAKSREAEDKYRTERAAVADQQFMQQMEQRKKENEAQRGMQALGIVQEIGTRQARYATDILGLGEQVNQGSAQLSSAQAVLQQATERFNAARLIYGNNPIALAPLAVPVDEAKAHVQELGGHLNFLAQTMRGMMAENHALDQQRAALAPLLAATGVQMPAPAAGGEAGSVGASADTVAPPAPAAPAADTGVGVSTPIEQQKNVTIIEPSASKGSRWFGPTKPGNPDPSGVAEPSTAAQPMEADPIQQASNYYQSNAFDDVRSDGRLVTVVTRSSEEAKRANEIRELIDPMLRGRIKVVDLESELKNQAKTLDDLVTQKYSKAIGHASRLNAAMSPTATEATMLEAAQSEELSGNKDTADQIRRMVGAPLETRKEVFGESYKEAKRIADAYQQDISAAEEARHKLVRLYGGGGLVDSQYRDDAEVGGSEKKPTYTTDADALTTWRSMKSIPDGQPLTTQQAIEFSTWLKDYKAKK